MRGPGPSHWRTRDWGQDTNTEDAAKAGNRTADRKGGAPTMAEEMMAAAHKIAFTRTRF